MPSREPELYKDKIEVSLDGRQIFYLFFGGAVLVGLVFVLGVMVGRRVESRSHVDQISSREGRSASDPLAALDGLESRKLSFQESLTKTPSPAVVDHKIEQIQLEHARASDKVDKLPNPEPKKIEPKKIEPKKAEPKKIEKEVKPEKAKRDKKAEQAKRADEARINADVVTGLDPKPDPKPEVKPEVKPDKAADKAKFTLQLSSFQDKKEAETFLSSVKTAGYQAYLTEADVSGKTFYRVRLGRYGSLDAANDAKTDVERAIKKSASVMRL